MKTVVLDAYTCSPDGSSLLKFSRLPGQVSVYNRTSEDEFLNRCIDADAILTNKVPITKERIAMLKNLRYIGVLATGYNVIDIQAASERGITVTNVPSYSSSAVAQHVFALLLSDVNHIYEYNERVHSGRWAASPDFCFFSEETEELEGKQFGIIGFGSIGRKAAGIAKAFGMKVTVFTPHPMPDPDIDEIRFTDLETLLRTSDVISIHCPLTKQTMNLFNKETLSMLKHGTRIINTARGQIINSSDMAEALNNGIVRSYLADVLETEPPKDGNPLLNCKNAVITPHIAWGAKETRERLIDAAIDNLLSFADGHPKNVVNP